MMALTKVGLALVVLVNVALTVYGLDWGLPARWNVDQEVTEALKMAAERRFLTHDIYHPPLYKAAALVAMSPYVGYLALQGESFSRLAEAASVSWHRLAQEAPDVASGVFLSVRGLSVALGALMILGVFCVGRRLMPDSGALAAAALLAVTMGFVGDNHLERSSPLVNMFGVLVLFCAVTAVERRDWPHARRARWLLWGGFAAGMSCAAKYNGVILALPLALAVIWMERPVRMLGRGVLCWIVGLLAGWPMLPASLTQLSMSADLYQSFLFSADGGAQPAAPFVARFIGYLIHLASVYGVPIAVFVGAGIALGVRRIARRQGAWRGWTIVLVFSLAYLLLASSFKHAFAHTKFIILIVPWLALFGGLAAGRLWEQGPRRVTAALLAAVFLYSAAYAGYASWLYAAGDTRHQVSQWIREQVSDDTPVEHLQQPSWLFEESLLDERRITFLDELTRDAYRSALKAERGESLHDALQERLVARMEQLMRGEASSPYLVVAFLEGTVKTGTTSADPWERLELALLSGRAPYRLARAFPSPNPRRPAAWWPAVMRPEHVWWHPVPNSYVAPTIHVYERVARPLAEDAGREEAGE